MTDLSSFGHEVGCWLEAEAPDSLKRARAADVAFGDAAWHRDRWARLHNY